MRLGLSLNYSGRKLTIPMDMVKRAEALGYDSVWASEAYSSDTISVAGWILGQTEKIKFGTAIMQLPARTPAMAAMTAMTLSQLSGGRFIMGLGASGPQVVEGWHGQPYNKPVTRMREYIQIIRAIMAREAPVEFDGELYQLPYKGEGSVGLGKPLKSILEADTSIPIYTASITPAGLACAAEVADGVFPIFYSPETFKIIEPDLQKGFAKAGNGKGLADFDIAPMVPVIVGDDLDGCRMFVKHFLALYIGGMGARNKNFYNDFAKKMGYEAEAVKIQDLYLDGKKDEAAAAVPDSLADQISLVGTKERIADRFEAWKDAYKDNHVGTMLLGIQQPEALELMAELAL